VYIRINSKNADARILNNFKKQIGDPNENKVYRGPCGSVKFKRLFRDSGYKIYEIDEYYTSKLCSNCESEIELFKEKEDHEKCNICRRNKLMGKIKLKAFAPVPVESLLPHRFLWNRCFRTGKIQKTRAIAFLLCRQNNGSVCL
jgi:hypothetical protein